MTRECIKNNYFGGCSTCQNCHPFSNPNDGARGDYKKLFTNCSALRDKIALVFSKEVSCLGEWDTITRACKACDGKGVVIVIEGETVFTLGSDPIHAQAKRLIPTFVVRTHQGEILEKAIEKAIDGSGTTQFYLPKIVAGKALSTEGSCPSSSQMSSTEVRLVAPSSIADYYEVGQAEFNPIKYPALSKLNVKLVHHLHSFCVSNDPIQCQKCSLLSDERIFNNITGIQGSALVIRQSQCRCFHLWNYVDRASKAGAKAVFFIDGKQAMFSALSEGGAPFQIKVVIISGGKDYISGDIIFRGGKCSSKPIGKYLVDGNGTITSIEMTNKGSCNELPRAYPSSFGGNIRTLAHPSGFQLRTDIPAFNLTPSAGNTWSERLIGGCWAAVACDSITSSPLCNSKKFSDNKTTACRWIKETHNTYPGHCRVRLDIAETCSEHPFADCKNDPLCDWTTGTELYVSTPAIENGRGPAMLNRGTIVYNDENMDKKLGTDAIDGGYSAYSEWSECSTKCEGYEGSFIGLQIRHRSCTNPSPKGEGLSCIALGLGPSLQGRSCNVGLCEGREATIILVTFKVHQKFSEYWEDPSSWIKTFENEITEGFAHLTSRKRKGRKNRKLVMNPTKSKQNEYVNAMHVHTIEEERKLALLDSSLARKLGYSSDGFHNLNKNELQDTAQYYGENNTHDHETQNRRRMPSDSSDDDDDDSSIVGTVIIASVQPYGYGGDGEIPDGGGDSKYGIDADAILAKVYLVGSRRLNVDSVNSVIKDFKGKLYTGTITRKIDKSFTKSAVLLDRGRKENKGVVIALICTTIFATIFGIAAYVMRIRRRRKQSREVSIQFDSVDSGCQTMINLEDGTVDKETSLLGTGAMDVERGLSEKKRTAWNFKKFTIGRSNKKARSHSASSCLAAITPTDSTNGHSVGCGPSNLETDDQSFDSINSTSEESVSLKFVEEKIHPLPMKMEKKKMKYMESKTEVKKSSKKKVKYSESKDDDQAHNDRTWLNLTKNEEKMRDEKIRDKIEENDEQDDSKGENLEVVDLHDEEVPIAQNDGGNLEVVNVHDDVPVAQFVRNDNDIPLANTVDEVPLDLDSSTLDLSSSDSAVEF